MLIALGLEAQDAACTSGEGFGADLAEISCVDIANIDSMDICIASDVDNSLCDLRFDPRKRERHPNKWHVSEN